MTFNMFDILASQLVTLYNDGTKGYESFLLHFPLFCPNARDHVLSTRATLTGKFRARKISSKC